MSQQSQQNQQVNHKVKWLAYAIAWLAYAGAFLTQLSKVGDVVRSSFNSISVPKKEDFYE
jgi:hypothetical protein